MPYYVARVLPDFMPIRDAYGYYVGFNRLSEAQVALGDRVDIHCPAGGEAELDPCPQQIDGLPCFFHAAPKGRYFTFPAKIARRLKDSDIDLIHAHTRIGLPVKAFGFDGKLVVHLHGLPYYATEPDLGYTRYDIYAYLYMRAYLRKADMVICYCRSLAHRVVELFDIEPEKVRVVYNGIDASLCERPLPCLESRGGMGDRSVVLFVGRAEPIKGTFEFLESLTMLGEWKDDIRVVFVGSGWAETLRDVDLPMETTVLPHVSHRQINRLYENADVHVAVTKAFGYQKTTMEAISCGTSVVATDNQDNRAICGDSGFYVDPFQPQDIAEGVRRALSSPPTWRQMRKDAQRVRRSFTWKRAAQECHVIYHQLCDI